MATTVPPPASESAPKDLIEPKVLALRLGVHPSTVHRWIHGGKLRAWRRAGTRYLVSEAEGLALLAPVEAAPPQGPRTPAEMRLAAARATARLRSRGYRTG